MIRLAVPEDFTSLMSIYAYARSFMQETGNPNQWGNHFPPEELIHNRIRDKQLFVLEENGTLHGAFAFIIGEDPTYLQIDHGNGVKSFYAHCSKLCVSQGQTVAAGETVALVGSTGVSTGPHLHLEIKCNGVHVDPAYYVTFLTD